MYAVIMAGGGGTRLHPLSRPERPKPFLPLLPSGETLLQATARGCRRRTSRSSPNAATSAFVRDQLPDAHVLLEPMGRNTAAAIAFATIAIDKPDDDVMLVVPADAYIDRGRPKACIRRCSTRPSASRPDAFEIEEPLVTFGVQADRPATEYGYLHPEARRRDGTSMGSTAYPLDRFEEKPTSERAEMLLKEPGVAWNAGHLPVATQRDPRRPSGGSPG